ncbi:MAG: hypothetical protein WEC80_01800 [Patescibacteria group bacterium]
MIKKKLYFLILFFITGLIFSQIEFTPLAGPNVHFTLFDFFAPIAAGFLGSTLGIVSVLAVSITNLISNGSYELGSIIRLFPILFAVYYFGLPVKKRTGSLILIVPISAMFIFWAHPAGREAWYFALYWLVPVIAYFKRDVLYLRALGATFTAHAVGGAAWVWAFNLPATVWQGLVPIVAYERTLFAAGIAASYFVFSYILRYLTKKNILPSGLRFEKTNLIFSK